MKVRERRADALLQRGLCDVLATLRRAPRLFDTKSQLQQPRDDVALVDLLDLSGLTATTVVVDLSILTWSVSADQVNFTIAEVEGIGLPTVCKVLKSLDVRRTKVGNVNVITHTRTIWGWVVCTKH